MKNRNDELREKTTSFVKKNNMLKHWMQLTVFLAVIAVGTTLYSVMKPGHSQEYFRKTLDCKYQVHQHTEDCYDENGNLICGQADYVVHVHNDDCYDENGNLICTLPEIKAHEHTDACYQEERVLVCDQEESDGHVHTEDCYETVQGDLICGMEEHTHTEDCYDEEGNLICGMEEHQHTDECYASEEVLVCGMEEGEGAHHHTDACYEVENVLVCGQNELHTHTDDCYDENGNLICGKLELKEHTHDADCFETAAMSPEEIEEMQRSADQAASTDPAVANDIETQTESSAVTETEESQAEEQTEPLVTMTEDGRYQQTATTENYIVTVTYGDDAQIPDEAVFKAREITEDDPEYEKYAQAYIENAGSIAVISYIMDSGFYVYGEEIEPSATVEVKVQAKDDDQTLSESENITHYKNNDINNRESIEVDKVDGENAIKFSMDSFSITVGSQQKDSIEIAVGDTITLSVNNPSKDTSYQWITYYNPGIVTLSSNGNTATVTGKSEGTIQIQLQHSAGNQWSTWWEYDSQISITVKAATNTSGNTSGSTSGNTSGNNSSTSSNITLTFDSTNGNLGLYSGANKWTKTVKAGETIELPTEDDPNFNDVNSARNDQTLAGWFEVSTKKVYKPGEEYTVPNTGSDILFYADWIAGDYDYGLTNNLGGQIASANTSGFVHTDIYDYNDLINSYASKYSNGSWTPISNADSSDYITFYDYQLSTEGGKDGTLGNPNNRNGKNAYTGGHTIRYPAILSSITDPILTTYFNSSSTGVHYLGSGDGLFYSVTSGTYKGYYEYDSASHAASYNQTLQKFFVYKNTQTVDDATGFAPLNAEDSSYPSKGGKTNYWFGMKTEINFTLPDKSRSSGSGNKVKIDGTDKDMIFYFSGDDDVWVFVDDELVLDIGGAHQACCGHINFATGQWATYNSATETSKASYSGTKNFTAGSHKITIYYLERGAGQSNCLIRFLLNPSTTLGVKKIDADDKSNLSGATFIIKCTDGTNSGKYYSYSNGLVSWVDSEDEATKMTTNVEGYADFKNLGEGSYKLIEKEAPDGYSNSSAVPDGELSFSVIPTGNKLVNGEDELQVSIASGQQGVTVDKDNKMTITVENKRVKYPIKLKKTDTDGANLKDAVFKIYESGTLSENTVTGYDSVGYYKSNGKGYLLEAEKKGDDAYNIKEDSTGLYQWCAGKTYYIKEIIAPTGYTKLSSIIPVSVTKDGILIPKTYTGGNAELVNPTDSAAYYELSISNTARDTLLKFYKVDELTPGLMLENAVFSLYKEDSDGSETISNGGEDVKVSLVEGFENKESTATGLIGTVATLEAGTYYLKEITPPDGYLALDDTVKFEVVVDTTKSSTDSDDINSNISIENLTIPGKSGDLSEYFVKNGSTYTIKIPNKTGYALPSTGGNGTDTIMTAGWVLLLAALGIFAFQRVRIKHM